MSRISMSQMTFTVLLACAALWGCQAGHTSLPFSESLELVGGEVDADTLNRGYEGYMLYCYACHGENGDGDGPASYALRPPPRDFRVTTFKFAGVAEGLAHDEDLKRIIMEGLQGTPMLNWDIPEPLVDDIIQYIKTFSPEDEGYRDYEGELGERIVPGDDPWGDARKDEAVKRGELVYHGSATCWSCHPSYLSEADISASTEVTKGKGISTFRPALFQSEIKETQYTIVLRDAEPCDDEDDEAAECPEGSSCFDGQCVRPVKVLPPDFTVNDVRSGESVENLYRVLAAGIPGTAMPAWKGSLPEEDIWAMAHYVNSIIALKDTPSARALKAKLKASQTK